MNHAFALRLAATFVSCAFASAQAVFTPIPSPFAPVVIPFHGACLTSGASGTWSSVRVSADGSTVATVVYQGPGVGSNGAAIRRGVVWTEAGGTQVITPDLFTISSEIFVPTGISADGSTVFGDHWMWSRTGGLQNLYAMLQPRVAAAGYFSASQILVCGASSDGSVVTGIVEDQVNNRRDYFLWQVGSPSLQFLPSNAQCGPACARFQSLSGNGLVVGGSALQPRPTFGDFSTAVLVSAAGSTAISAQSTGCNYSGVWDVNFDGSVAVGAMVTTTCNQSAFRYTAAGGVQAFGPSGSAAYACNANGDVVVGDYLNFGVAGTKPFVWTPTLGFRDLQSELVTSWGLGDALQGWTLVSATDVSADGRVIVGTARNPAGCEQSFVVRFPTTPAAVLAYGPTCNGPQGQMRLLAIQPPYLGAVAQTRCTAASASALQVGVLGFGPLSIPLSSLLAEGVPGCELLVVPDRDRWLTVANGQAEWMLPIPAQQVLLGVSYWQQVFRLDAGAGGALQSVAASNGLRLTIGRY